MDEEAATSAGLHTTATTTNDDGPDAVKIPEHWSSGTKSEKSGDGSQETRSTFLPWADMEPMLHGEVRTLDGEIAVDEFAGDAINYQILLKKIDTLLERLKLDA